MIVSKTKKIINVNIQPQQLFYEETFNMLNKLAEHSSQLCIEITEYDTNSSIQDNSQFFLLCMIKRLKKIGFLVALDDVGTGIHTLNNILPLLNEVDVIKFSILPFNKKTKDEGLFLASCWNKLAQAKGIEFVVEGIEDGEMEKELIECEAFLQQGFYLGKPVRI